MEQIESPRMTPAGIEATIVSEFYFTAADGVLGESEVEHAHALAARRPPSLYLLTFCVLVLRNGFTVTGESACYSPEDFNPVLGRKIARAYAVNKLWPLMGYHLKEQLYQAKQPAQAPV